MLIPSENMDIVLNSAVGGLSRWAKLRARFRHICCLLMERFHLAARIKEFEYVDPNTNETVYLSTGAQYSVLHVGDKQYYFNRFTGGFDGTSASLEERVSSGLELCD